MELKEKITLDMLTKDSVSVLRQQFLTFNGEEMQVGGNIRNAYMNDESGIEQLRKVLSDEYFNAVMAVITYCFSKDIIIGIYVSFKVYIYS